MRTCAYKRLPQIVLYSAMLFMALAFFAATSRAADRFADNASVTVHMKNSQGDSVGTVEIVQLAKGTLFITDLNQLPPGKHAFHVHANGKCEPPDFESAGGHYNPADREHGFDNQQGHHAGDLPNIYVTEQGSAKIEIFVPWLKLGKSTTKQEESTQTSGEQAPFVLLDDNGSAIVIHKYADDYEAVPPDSAGARIACGVID